MKIHSIVLASASAIALSSGALAAVTYNTQSRDVRSTADVNGFGFPTRPINNAIIAAPDFGPFNQQSETISGGPPPNASATGRASQQSALLPDRIDFAGTIFAQDANSSGGVGSAGAESNLATNFSVGAQTPYAFTFALTPPSFIGNDVRGYTVSLIANSGATVFNFQSTIGPVNGPFSYSSSGSLEPGAYTLTLNTYLLTGGSGTNTATSPYASTLTLPSAPAAAVLAIPALASLRRRRSRA